MFRLETAKQGAKVEPAEQAGQVGERTDGGPYPVCRGPIGHTIFIPEMFGSAGAPVWMFSW